MAWRFEPLLEELSTNVTSVSAHGHVLGGGGVVFISLVPGVRIVELGAVCHGLGLGLVLGPVLGDGVELLVAGDGLEIQFAAELVDLVQDGVGVLSPLWGYLDGNRCGSGWCALRSGRSGQCG